MSKPAVDYGLYLVTEPVSGLEDVVESALRGGATVVQLRDKKGRREDVAAMASRLLAVTRRFDVPLLINDDVEMAIDVGADGAHVGQDDLEASRARALLGPDRIMGVSASTAAEAVAACEAGADYLGLGAVFVTPTKSNTRAVLGPAGVRVILAALAEAGHGAVPAVAIGGIDAANAARVLALSRAPAKPLDGLAVVRAVVAASDPASAAAHLRSAVLVSRVGHVVACIAAAAPLSHNMTNLVVQNLAANVVLAIGASPIMSSCAREAPDLAALGGGALVINTGTVTADGLANQLEALAAYNGAGRPVVLDPVGVGATTVRRDAVDALLAAGHFAVIKGNASELLALHLGGGRQRGVDSSAALDVTTRAALARAVARRHSCVVVLTGQVDVVSDGRRTVRVANGHELLGAVTGSGCCLGAVVAAALAAHESDALLAALAAVVLYAVAAELAAARSDVRGPGSFVPALLDELYGLRRAAAGGDVRWLALVKVEAVDVDDEATPSIYS
ncbi:hypothetical protein XA68_13210 [Ophiocordyceps unilateralis]|uniref:Thiamine phosphate synthase/TenI domain-containing protein n=1 Tax=Ophiocordyceps unilateralis TaxID=268505 RepID=A0A2A9PC56_OPHUN|nr:hypothetical protein XA68_13210 [Ophiocordyceps unilateralis]